MNQTLPITPPPDEWHLNPGQERALLLLAGKQRNTLLLGGARCVAGDTIIDGTGQTIAALAKRGERVCVRTTHGEQWVDAPFVKGSAPLLDIRLQSGRSVRVTTGHQFWDGDKWIKAAMLCVGSSVAVRLSGPYLRASSSARDPQAYSDTPVEGAYALDIVRSITSAACQEFYTFHVPGCAQYFANGILHHNSGKTFLFVRSIIIRSMLAPGSRHLIARFRSNACRSSVWLDTFPKVLRICYPGLRAKDNRQDGYTVMPNGAEIWFVGLDDKERVEKVLGMEFATILFSEASQIPYASYVLTRTRLAQVVLNTYSGKPLSQKEYADLNPGGSGHWTHKLFFEKIEPLERKPLTDPEEYAYAVINPEDNQENLDPASLNALRNLPARQRARFYEGAYQPEVEGALWSFDVISASRFQEETITPEQLDAMMLSGQLPSMQRMVVAIDPSGTKGEEGTRSDDVGIVVAGKGVDGKGYVFADLTVNAPPEVWGRIAVSAYHAWKCDRIVAERNFGGSMVEFVVKTADPLANYIEVTASRGKAVRAEPISALYAQDKVRHVGTFLKMEDEMMSFAQSGYMGFRSPDRADALIWALTDLCLEEDPGAIWELLGQMEARGE